MPDGDIPRLLSLVAHEVRGPLGVIRGYLRLLEQRADLPDAYRLPITASLRACDNATQVLGQASKIAELHRDGAAKDRASVALDVLLDEAINRLTLPAQPPIRVTRGDGHGRMVRLDGAALQSVLTTLLTATARAQGAAATIALGCHDSRVDDRDGIAIELRTPPDSAVIERPVDLTRGGLGLALPLADLLVSAQGGRLVELRDGPRLAGFRAWVPNEALHAERSSL